MTSPIKIHGLSSIFPIVLLVFSLFSCGPEQLFKDSQKMAQNIWSYDDSVSFQFEITDTTETLDVLLYLNHTEDYAYQNLYFTLGIAYPDGVKTLDTLSINVSDKMGMRKAKCRGGSCQLYTALMKHVRFQQAGKYRFIFNQFTRIDSLAGIHELGLYIEKSGTGKE